MFDNEMFDHAMIALAASAAFHAYEDADEIPLYTEDSDFTGDEIKAEGGPFVIPVLIPEGVESGDGRTFAEGSIEHRNLPLPLLWQIKTGDGHDGSVIVGRIDGLERLESGGLGNAYGVFDTGPYGREAERLVRHKFLRGVSADLDRFEANVEDESASVASSDDGDEAPMDDTRQKIKSDKINVTKGRVMAATLVPKPAFQEVYITMADDPEILGEDLIEDGVYEEDSEDPEAVLAALTAAAAPVTPPKAWFSNPELSAPTPITVDDDGRVYGHIASWEMSHIGMGGRQIRPPKSASNYAYFRTGILRTAEGSDVPVGQLTLAGGHASMQADASAAVKHYDDTASAVADVAAGEDQFGIWVAGALRPSVTPEQVRVLRASAPSGDWRPINGRLELVAVCQVNVPGFPVARAMVAGGQVTALVAAGASYIAALRDEPMKTLTDRVSRLEHDELAKRRAEAAARISPLAQQRRQALLASAEAARQRMQPTRERRDALLASAEDARQRVLALKLAPERAWDEKEHPRDTEGKFREIVARLGDILTGVSGGDKATDKIKSAADHEDNGNPEAAADAAREARATLTELEDAATDPATVERIKQAENEIDAAIGDVDPESEPVPSEEPVRVDEPADDPASAPAPGDDESGLGDAIEEQIDIESGADAPLDRFISWAINQIVAQVDPTQAIRNAPNEFRRFLDGKEFKDNSEFVSYIQELIRRAVSPI